MVIDIEGYAACQEKVSGSKLSLNPSLLLSVENIAFEAVDPSDVKECERKFSMFPANPAFVPMHWHKPFREHTTKTNSFNFF